MRRRDEAPARVLWGPGRRWETEAEYWEWVRRSREQRRRLLALIEAERAVEGVR